MTQEEKEEFKVNADSNFMTLSQYIRWCETVDNFV